MANETTTTSVTEIVQAEIIGANVRDSVHEKAIMLGFMDVKDIESEPSLTATYPILEAMTATAKGAQGDAVANTEHTLAEATITASEAANLAATIMDITAKSTTTSVVDTLSRAFSLGLQRKFDTDALALNGSVTNNVSSTGVNITFANMETALTTLRINAEGAADQAVFMLYPQQVSDLRGLVIDKAEGLAPALAREQLVAICGDTPNSRVLGAQAGSYQGIPVFQNALVPTKNTGADSAGALMCVGENPAYGATIKWMPEIESARATPNRQKGTVYYGSFAYGVGIIDNNFVVGLVTDR